MNNPLLSICIPTYNRAHYLERCLEGVTLQFSDPDIYSCVEIVISNNASVDNTRDIVSSYQDKFSNIRYFENEKNLGFDFNIVNVVENAKGEYCWYLGDDDVLCGGSLRRIVDFLRNNKIAVLTIDAKLVPDPSKASEGEQYFNSDAFKLFDDFRDFWRNGHCFGILSVFIFDRFSWVSSLDKEEFIVDWLYFETVLKILPKANLQFAFCDHPVVYTRQGSELSSNGGEFISFVRWKRLLDKMTKFGYSKDVIGLEVATLPRGLITSLLRAKGHNLKFSFKNLFIICDEFNTSPPYLLLAIIIFFIPNFIIKLVRDFNKRFIKIKI